MLEFFERYDEHKYGTDGGPLHDPDRHRLVAAAGAVFRPLLQCRDRDRESPLTQGMTVIDWWQVTDRPHNALVIRDVDADGFFDLLTDHISKL